MTNFPSSTASSSNDRFPSDANLVAGYTIDEVSIQPIGEDEEVMGTVTEWTTDMDVEEEGVAVDNVNKKPIDLTNSILSVSYFENILEPCVAIELEVYSSSSIFNEVPIRGGERVEIDIKSPDGTHFERRGAYAMYVYKVSGMNSDKLRETFTLHLVSKEFMVNETVRCKKKFHKTTIDTHVHMILQSILKTTKENIIEPTYNSYTFIGNMKKPFHTIQWLAPKSISKLGAAKKGEDEDGEKANGTGGYLFYENQNGFNFRSIDQLVSRTKSEDSADEDDTIFTYVHSGVVEQNAGFNSRGMYGDILKFFWDRTVDVRKSLRVGMYSNLTYHYDVVTNELSRYNYSLTEQMENAETLGADGIPPDVQLFGKSPSRVLSTVSDHGTLDQPFQNYASNAALLTSGRDKADMAKSFSRYNLLFQQALNILVPCNIHLKVGDIVKCYFPKRNTEKSESDPKTSGYYLIRELRHSFVPNQNTTSLKLMRDSYGID